MPGLPEQVLAPIKTGFDDENQRYTKPGQGLASVWEGPDRVVLPQVQAKIFHNLVFLQGQPG
jgi:hypothetical protein